MSSAFRRYVAEAAGTFMLVAIGPGAVMIASRTSAFGHEGVALAFGLAVLLCVASLGHVSGAHINPAVTLGFWSRGRFPARTVPGYIVAQCLGAVLASALLGWLVGPIAMFGATTPNLPIAQSFVVEFGFSAILGLVIMGVATDERVPSGVAPFAIGGTVYVGALVTGPLTGGSFNPARSLGPAVLSGVWTAHWLYWIAPILGVAAGMKLYDVFRGQPEAFSSPSPIAALGVDGPIGG